MIELIITKTAEEEIIAICEFLLYKFGPSSVDKFENFLNTKIQHIHEFPDRYPLMKDGTDIRKAVVNKRCIICFILTKEAVVIMNVFDTRRNPGLII
ncbi:MAG: type II toxin-antitoxin system RelE/ParE family toxin [Chitinophagaceae bacterium]|nr:type II toxin-antitoxin system RelE/ParE family toxin [Chitinophagaceae bacterium]